MSANNQIPIKLHNGKYYLLDVTAESWSDKNELYIVESYEYADILVGALDIAHKSDDTEYGVIQEKLAKDDADVSIVGDEFMMGRC